MPHARRPRITLLRGIALAIALAAAAIAYMAGHAFLGSLRSVHPPRQAPPLAGTGTLAAYSEVEFTAADGVRLSAWWRPSANGAAIVLAHGLGANRAQLLPQAGPLAAAGFGVLLLDLRAHGRSGGDLSTWGAEERLDLAAAARFAAAQPGVRPGAVGAIGFSIGAVAVAGAAVNGGSFRAVALEAMAPSAEEDVRETFSARGPISELPARWAAVLAGVHLDEARPAEHMSELAPRPVLLVYGEDDPAAPVKVGRALQRAAGGSTELVVIPGAGHGAWEGAQAEALAARLRAFFEAALR
jgi:dipeptidyl aminopeptidase/acylaminoacyl peptidase